MFCFQPTLVLRTKQAIRHDKFVLRGLARTRSAVSFKLREYPHSPSFHSTLSVEVGVFSGNVPAPPSARARHKIRLMLPFMMMPFILPFKDNTLNRGALSFVLSHIHGDRDVSLSIGTLPEEAA